MVRLETSCPACGNRVIVFVADGRCSVRCDTCQLYAQADNPILCSKIFNRLAHRRRVMNILKGLKYKNVSADGKR